MDLHSGVTVESQLVSQLDCCRPVARRSSGGASSTISPCSVAKSLKTDVVRNEGSRINTRVLTSAKLLHVKSQSPQLSTDHHWSMVKPVPAPWCDQSPRWSAILGDIVPKPATESVKVPQRTYYIYNISTNNHKYTWWFWGVRLESEMAHVKISLFCRDQRCTAMPCRKPKINLDGAAAGVGQHGQLPRYCVRWWETWHSQNIGEWPAEFEHRFEHRLQPQCTIFMYCSWIRIPVYICVLKKNPNNPFESENEHDTIRFPGIFSDKPSGWSDRRDLPWLANKLQWLHQEPPIWIVEVLPEQLRPFVSAPLTDSVLWKTKKGAVSAVWRINKWFCPKMEDVSNMLLDMF